MSGQTNQSKLSNQAIADDMVAYLQAYLETGYFMGSVLVARGSEILLNQGYGMANLEHGVKNAPHTKFCIGSVTKQFTATAILQLQQQGLLNVNQAISTYLPDYPKGEQITVHHLLNHTAGIPNYTDVLENPHLRVTLDEVITWFSDKPLEFTPGDRFKYCNSGYVLLTKIIETISGQSYANYLQNQLFEPLGMTASGYEQRELILPYRASGYTITETGYQNASFWDQSQGSGAGAMYSTTEDLYKWERSFYTDAVLNEVSKKAMFASTILTSSSGSKSYYGYGWYIDTYCGRDRHFHAGGFSGFRAIIARYPSEQLLVIALSNITGTSIELIAQDLATIVFGEPYELPKQRRAIELDVNSTVYDAYVGEYELEPGLVATVTNRSKRFFIQITGQKQVEIFPESLSEFFVKIVDARITFILDGMNKAQRLIIHRNGNDSVATRVDVNYTK
ncbi:serine hydrolase [Scytonema sp. NUACC26]|uniref:serine hydrolase n=1 Tax=Scytonema sp. NUACC26 TaxID=3140176 RepID=UPI0034DB90EB